MPLFIDRLPFHRWTDPTRTPALSYWTIVVPVVLTEPTMLIPPPITGVQDWLLDTGNRGEAFAWRHHLVQAGLDPDKGRMPQPMIIRTHAGRLLAPVRDADLWLISNIPNSSLSPYRITLHRGLPFHDVPTLPDPQFERPLIGIRAMRSAGLRVELDFGKDTVSIWTPDSNGS